MIKLVSQALTKKEDGEKGFTLIELLVVVIIIGILAAIAIPVFLNMREGAWRSSVESDVSNAVLVVEQATTANNGSLDGLTQSATTGSYTFGSGTNLIAGAASDGNTITITPTGNTYTVVGYNVDLGETITYTYTSSTGVKAWSDR